MSASGNKSKKFTIFLKGTKLERRVARFLWKLGYAVVRAPASGGGGKGWIEPDLVVMKNGKAIAIELAYRSRLDNIKVLTYKVKKLREFVERARIPLYLCVKYARQPIRCISYEYLFKELETGSKLQVVVPKDKILREGIKLTDLLRETLS